MHVAPSVQPATVSSIDWFQLCCLNLQIRNPEGKSGEGRTWFSTGARGVPWRGGRSGASAVVGGAVKTFLGHCGDVIDLDGLDGLDDLDGCLI